MTPDGKTPEPRRPDPDALLAEAKRAGRGELRVFLGMAPGVGKTFAMLSSAQRRRPCARGWISSRAGRSTTAPEPCWNLISTPP